MLKQIKLFKNDFAEERIFRDILEYLELDPSTESLVVNKTNISGVGACFGGERSINKALCSSQEEWEVLWVSDDGGFERDAKVFSTKRAALIYARKKANSERFQEVLIDERDDQIELVYYNNVICIIKKVFK